MAAIRHCLITFSSLYAGMTIDTRSCTAASFTASPEDRLADITSNLASGIDAAADGKGHTRGPRRGTEPPCVYGGNQAWLLPLPPSATVLAPPSVSSATCLALSAASSDLSATVSAASPALSAAAPAADAAAEVPLSAASAVVALTSLTVVAG